MHSYNDNYSIMMPLWVIAHNHGLIIGILNHYIVLLSKRGRWCFESLYAFNEWSGPILIITCNHGKGSVDLNTTYSHEILSSAEDVLAFFDPLSLVFSSGLYTLPFRDPAIRPQTLVLRLQGFVHWFQALCSYKQNTHYKTSIELHTQSFVNNCYNQTELMK